MACSARRRAAVRKRVDVVGRQQMWFIDQSESGYTLAAASRPPSGEWSSFVTGEPHDELIAAAQSDDTLISLRSDEVTIYKIVTSEEYSGKNLNALSKVLTCVGLESPQVTNWPQEIGSVWSASDSELENASNGFECTSRWAFLNELRVSCIRFEDVTPPDLIPVLFDQWSNLDTWDAEAEASFSEDDNMGRPFSWSGQMTFVRFRPGYAISLRESDADVIAGPSYLTRLPLDRVEEAAIINAWQELSMPGKRKWMRQPSPIINTTKHNKTPRGREQRRRRLTSYSSVVPQLEKPSTTTGIPYWRPR